MDEPKYPIDADITLVDTIEKISSRIVFSGSKQDLAHTAFLLEVVEDMQAQVDSVRHLRSISA